MAINGALVKRTSSLTGQNYSTAANIAWDAESYDVGGWHDNSSNNSRLTCPVGFSGYVQLACSVVLANIGQVSVSATIILLKNNSADFDGACQSTHNGLTGGNNYLAFTSGAIPASAGDYFEVSIQVTGDTSVDQVHTRMFFSIREVAVTSGAMVRKASSQTGANFTTIGAVAWDQEVYDVGGWHDNSSNNSRLTAPSGFNGWVELNATVRFDNVTALNNVIAILYRNGSAAFDGACGNMARVVFVRGSINFTSCPIYAVAGDYFEVFYRVTTDTSNDIINTRSNFSVRQLA